MLRRLSSVQVVYERYKDNSFSSSETEEGEEIGLEDSCSSCSSSDEEEGEDSRAYMLDSPEQKPSQNVSEEHAGALYPFCATLSFVDPLSCPCS